MAKILKRENIPSPLLMGLQVISSFIQKNPFGTEVNEILGTDTSSGEVPKINVKLKKGDQIVIAGMSSANFTKR
ncbi:hypothetical protein [Lacticaseibacillus manihotivorans]|uniref:hypothetical protein n=1 Tax=Lacticaseibacillus manihotivorans TaxID=88233 RepID=UPI001FB37545|nr:hypothetical protein [Lacticaseibacillus manihotivorans]